MHNANNEPAWRGDTNLPPAQQGLTVLGVPMGHQAYIQSQLEELRKNHRRLLSRIPEVPDLQAAWLLLSFWGATRANFYLRTLDPEHSRLFARNHDEDVWQCLSSLLDIDPAIASANHSLAMSQLPQRRGGLGLRSAVRVLPAAAWAS